MSKKNKSINTYILVSAISAVGLGGILTVLTVETFGKVPVLVANSDIAPYSRAVTEEDFRIIEVSKGDKKHFANFADNKHIAQLVGKIPNSSITSGQPVKLSQFIDPDNPLEVNTIVSDGDLRGIYLPISYESALSGDMKVGSIVDFYLMVQEDKPTAQGKTEKEWIAHPFQKSYEIKKIKTNEDNSMLVFFEFPKEDSEKYLLLNQNLSDKSMYLTAVMPNPLHNSYEGTILTNTDFKTDLNEIKDYFTPMTEILQDKKSQTNMNTTNNFENNQNNAASNSNEIDNSFGGNEPTSN